MLGAVWPYASATPPAHTLACDGAIYNRVDYPFLYDALDPAFILDADTFQVPDLHNRFPFGADLVGGGDFPVGSTGGEIDHTLTESEMPSHTHTDVGHVHGYIFPSPTAINGGVEAPAPAALPTTGAPTSSGNANLTNTGGDGAHNNMPPFLALRWCIVFE